MQHENVYVVVVHTVTVVDTFIRTLKALSAVAQHGGLQIGGTATTPLTLLN